MESCNRDLVMTRDPCIGVSQVIKRYAVVVVSVQYYPTYNNFLRDSRICLPKGGHMTPVFLVSRFFCCSQWSNVQAICLCSISLDKVHCFKKKRRMDCAHSFFYTSPPCKNQVPFYMHLGSIYSKLNVSILMVKFCSPLKK
jgi:hypothetical protein